MAVTTLVFIVAIPDGYLRKNEGLHRITGPISICAMAENGQHQRQDTRNPTHKDSYENL